MIEQLLFVVKVQLANTVCLIIIISGAKLTRLMLIEVDHIAMPQRREVHAEILTPNKLPEPDSKM